MPSFGISLLTATLPVILMLISTIVQLVTGHEDPTNWFEQIIYLIGTAGTAMLIAVIFAIFSMGVMRQRKMENIMESVTNAIYPIGMMLLIIGGGGTFKQVLIDGGVGTPSLKCLKVQHVTYIARMDCRSCITYCAWISYSCCGLNNRYRDTFITSFSYERCISCARNWCRKCYPIPRQ